MAQDVNRTRIIQAIVIQKEIPTTFKLTSIFATRCDKAADRVRPTLQQSFTIILPEGLGLFCLFHGYIFESTES